MNLRVWGHMSAADLPASKLLGDRYRLVERLGAGGMAVVWRGFDEVLGRQVAVKVLSAASSDDPGFRRRLRIEAQAAARLSHPHITGVYDYGESTAADGSTVPYVVMELVDGESLAAVLARIGTLPWPAAVRMCAEVAAALAAAHARGIVHRDIAPANVMLTVAGAKVVDFGISALVGENDIDPDGSLLGTPAYLAPERLDGGQVSAATDVYAVGLLLYRSLTGMLPWDAGTTTALLRAHQYTEPDPLPPIDGLPAEVADVCRRSLAKQPTERPGVGELARIFAQAALRAPATPLPLVTGADGADGHTTILPWRSVADDLALTGPSGEIAAAPAASPAAPAPDGARGRSDRAVVPGQRVPAGHGSGPVPGGPSAGGLVAVPAAAAALPAQHLAGSAQDGTSGRDDAPSAGAVPAAGSSAGSGSSPEAGSSSGAAEVPAQRRASGPVPPAEPAAPAAQPSAAGGRPGGDEPAAGPALTAVVGTQRRNRRTVVVAGMAVAAVAGGAYGWTAWDPSAGKGDQLAAAPPSAAPDGNALPQAPCVVTYSIEKDEKKRFRASVRVANRTSRSVDDWALRFALPGDQTVVGESPLATEQDGRNVTAVSTELIRPGGAQTVYLNGQYRASNLLPSTFTLNDASCAVLLSDRPGAPPTLVVPRTGGVAAGVPDGVPVPSRAVVEPVTGPGAPTGPGPGPGPGPGSGPSSGPVPSTPPPPSGSPVVDDTEDDDRGKSNKEKEKKAKKILKKNGIVGSASPTPSAAP
jgi:serine/threonine-protein kinase